MAKKKMTLLGFILGLVGILVSLTIGFSMIGGTLLLPVWLGGATVSMITGYALVIATFLGIIMSFIK